MWARCSDDCCDNFICKPLVADLDGPLMSSDLQIRDLTVGFPGRTLFRAPDMDIPAGTILAVLGANGSGKSSFVKALLGVLSPMSGEVIGLTKNLMLLPIWHRERNLISFSLYASEI